MLQERKASRIRLTLLLLGLAGLCACADTEWPQWISGEPTKAELSAYKGPIAMPAVDTENKPWPNLADVPPRPNVLMTPQETLALTNEMKQENKEAQARIEKIQAEENKKAKTR
jgi:hypothetical protein